MCAPIEEMLTIAPEPRARIPGRTALIMVTEPKKWVSNNARTSASSPSSTAARYSYPALLTSTSTAPNPVLGLPDDGCRPRRVGDVQRRAQHPIRAQLHEVGDRGLVARGDHGGVPGLDDRSGKGSTEPARAAGDEPGGHGVPLDS